MEMLEKPRKSLPNLKTHDPFGLNWKRWINSSRNMSMEKMFNLCTGILFKFPSKEYYSEVYSKYLAYLFYQSSTIAPHPPF